MNNEQVDHDDPVYFTAAHLLEALKAMDPALLDYPLVLVHGKELSKPHLVHGVIPTPTPVDRQTVAAKQPSLLTLAALTDLMSAAEGGKTDPPSPG